MTLNYWQNPNGMSRATIRTIINQIGVVDHDLLPKEAPKSNRLSPVDHPRNISTRERYRDVLRKIGRPATSREIANKIGNGSTSVVLFNRKNPGFFSITYTKDFRGKPVRLYWIDGVEKDVGGIG